jgi:hypothetical protein
MTESPEDGYICSHCGLPFANYAEWFGHTCGDIEGRLSREYDRGYNNAMEADLRVLEELQEENRTLRQMTRGCPCLYVGACSYACSCVHPLMSGGCRRCCLYGSEEQRTSKAQNLAEVMDAAHRRWLKTFDEGVAGLRPTVTEVAWPACSLCRNGPGKYDGWCSNCVSDHDL